MTLLDQMLDAARAASAVILEVYARNVGSTRKEDGSPVTEADSRAEAVIFERLATAGLPVLAEESVAAGRIPALGEAYFVVDPLDGTREFLKRNGEFTVNIALCEGVRPTIGVLIAPALGRAFWGSAAGAFAASFVDGRLGEAYPISPLRDGPIRIVASRSHGRAQTAELLRRMKADDVSVGSALKFGLLAAGEAELYPRAGPTCEWDTAAGQALLEAAGGVVVDLEGVPLTYGHTERKFLNPPFVAAASRALADTVIAEIRRLEAAPAPAAD